MSFASGAASAAGAGAGAGSTATPGTTSSTSTAMGIAAVSVDEEVQGEVGEALVAEVDDAFAMLLSLGIISRLNIQYDVTSSSRMFHVIAWWCLYL